MTPTRVAVLAIVTALSACGKPDAPPSDGGAGTETPSGGDDFTRRVYERNFVFASLSGDSVFMVPWVM